MHFSISGAAAYLGLSISTLRRWHSDGYLVPDYKAVGGHRRYSMTSLKAWFSGSPESSDMPQANKTILYSRVSSSDQKKDLSRQ